MATFLHLVIANIARTIKSATSMIGRALQEQRRERARMEAELNRGRLKICSKNDDDLPIAS
jgi:hypothetical protein